LLAVAGTLGVVVAEVGSDHDYGTAFDTLVERRVGALIVAHSEVMANDAEEIVALAERNAVPTIYERRADVVAGGLMSYGASQAEAWRQGGIYVAEILQGAKPAVMRVMESRRLELTINTATARSLGLTISPSLRAQANEVIE
jgi:putative ABC transport system substrate-binding protein